MSHKTQIWSQYILVLLLCAEGYSLDLCTCADATKVVYTKPIVINVHHASDKNIFDTVDIL